MKKSNIKISAFGRFGLLGTTTWLNYMKNNKIIIKEGTFPTFTPAVISAACL